MLRRRIEKQPNLVQCKDLENQLINTKRTLASLKFEFRDFRIFYNNRFKSLKKVRNTVRRKQMYEKLDQNDFKTIKDEINVKNVQLNKQRQDNHRLEH